MWPKLSKTVAMLLVLIGLNAAVHAAKTISAVKDLAYGVALYEYYQDDYLSALTELAIAEKRQNIKHHGNHPQLLSAGIELSYGMDKQAQRRLNQIIATQNEGQVLDQAWFYSAKMLHQRGDYQGSLNALKHVRGTLPKPLRDEFNYLDLFNPEDLSYEQIDKRLENFDKKKLWLAYTLYNVAMTYYAKKEYHVASSYLEQIFPRLHDDEESLLLKDRAYLALAYVALARHQPDVATRYFQKISLHTNWSQQALLGFGWASLENDNPQMALSAWVELLSQAVAGSAVQEAWIGVPVIYQQLGVEQEALNLFYKAEEVFAKELEKLSNLQQQMTPERVYQEFVQADKQTGSSWFYRSRGLGINPVSPYLVNLISQQSFQSLLKDLRDLEQVKKSLKKTQTRSQGLLAASSVRDAAYAKQLERYQTLKVEPRFQTAIKQYQRLAHKVQEKLDDKHVNALMNVEQRAHWERIQSAKKTLQQLAGKGESLTEEQALLSIYDGLLQFDLIQSYPSLRWQLQRQQIELHKTVTEAESRLNNIRRLIHEKPQLDAFTTRIESFNQQTAILQHRADVLEVDIKNRLQQSVSRELMRQKKRIRYYLTQAKLNITKVLDARFRSDLMQGRDQSSLKQDKEAADENN